MPKANKTGFYAVARGRVPGVYSTWLECEVQVKNFSGARYKKVRSRQEADDWIRASPAAASYPSASSSGHKPYERPQQITPTHHPCSTSLPSSSTATSVLRTLHSVPSKVHKYGDTIVGEIEDETGWDVVFCDGACKGNGKAGSVAGVGVWWGHDDPRNIAERCPGDQTNNRAELTAMVRVLETTPCSRRPLLIKTDSQYSLNCINRWIPKWEKNNWKASNGNPVKNLALIRYLDTLIQYRRQRGQKVHTQYVQGHAGIEGNEGADAMANMGTLMSPQWETDWDTLREELEDEPVVLFAPDPSAPNGNEPEGSLTALNRAMVPASLSMVAQGRIPLPLSKNSALQSGVSERMPTDLEIEEAELTRLRHSMDPCANPPTSQSGAPLVHLPFASDRRRELPLPALASPATLTPVPEEDVADYADCLMNDDQLADLDLEDV